MKINHLFFLVFLVVLIPKAKAQGLDDPAVQDYLKTIGVLPQEEKKEEKPEEVKDNKNNSSPIATKVESAKKDIKANSSLKEIVSKIVDDLEKNRRLSGKNLADALKDKIQPSSAKNIKPEELKENEKNLNLVLSKLEALDKGGFVAADKLKESAMGVLTSPEYICKNEKEECPEKAGCCAGLKCIPRAQKKENKTVYLCVKPIALGKTCEPQQSVCEKGSCIEYYTNSTVLPICSQFGKSCKKDAECCSEICDNGKCNTSYRCQDCIPSGQKLDRSKPEKKCCLGLYDNLDGMCVSDYPPQASYQPKKKSFFKHLISFILDEAQAEEVVVAPDENSDFNTCTFNSKRNYYKQLQQAIDQTGAPELRDAIDAMRAFEYMALGAGVEDMWKKSGKNIHTQAKELATIIKNARLDTETKFKSMDDFMTCSCIEIKGLTNPTVTEAQKTFYTSTCLASSVTGINNVLSQNNVQGPTVVLGDSSAPAHALDDQGLGASGIKYKEMLVRYYAKRIEIQAQLLNANVAPAQGFMDIANFISVQEWDKQNKEWHYWDGGHYYKTVPEEWADMIASFINDCIGNALNDIKSRVNALVNAIPTNSVLWKIPLLWRLGFHPPECWEDTGRNWNTYICVGDACTRSGTHHYFSCKEERNAPNDVCGMLAPNSFCVKTAVKRLDHSTSGENRYLIDPLVPDGYTLPYQHNIFAGMNWNTTFFPTFNPYGFDDTYYGTMKAHAATYAQTQDFYQTDADRQRFAEYVIDKHLFKPYLSNPGEVKYPTPGIISYYEDMYNKLDFISTAILYIITPPSSPNGGDGDSELFIKYANDYVKTVNGLGGGVKVTPGHGALQAKVTDAIAAIKMVTFHINPMGSNSPGGVKDFADLKNSYFDSKIFGDFDRAKGSSAIAKAKKKKVYDDWMNKVGNTAKGKAMLEAKRNSLNGIYGAPQGIAESGNQGAPSSHSDNQTNATVASADLSGIKNAAKKSSSSSDYYEGDGGGNRGRGNNSSENRPTEEKVKEVLAEIKSETYQPINQDTLFQIVSKAYARGAFPVLLYGQPGIPLNKNPEKKPELDVQDEHVFAPTKSVKRKAPSSPVAPAK